MNLFKNGQRSALKIYCEKAAKPTVIQLKPIIDWLTEYTRAYSWKKIQVHWTIHKPNDEENWLEINDSKIGIDGCKIQSFETCSVVGLVVTVGHYGVASRPLFSCSLSFWPCINCSLLFAEDSNSERTFELFFNKVGAVLPVFYAFGETLGFFEIGDWLCLNTKRWIPTWDQYMLAMQTEGNASVDHKLAGIKPWQIVKASIATRLKLKSVVGTFTELEKGLWRWKVLPEMRKQAFNLIKECGLYFNE